MNYHVLNLGCKVNRVESDSYEKQLSSSGLSQSSLEEADAIVVNTCTVTGEAEKKTRKAVRSALRKNPRAHVLVTGCAAAIAPDVFTAMDARVEVVAKPEVSERLTALYQDRDAHAIQTVSPGRARIGVKVQDGCDNACTFCIVHVARGRATSVPLQKVLDDCIALAESDVREIVLTGINLGTYRDGDVGIAALIRRLLDATQGFVDEEGRACRFRISSIEPRDVSDALIDVLAATDGRVCRHLHLPLQSGSGKVLREMARPYDAESFQQLVDRLRQNVPTISLSTDVIAGFPGETEDDHADTQALCRSAGFSKMHVFPYSLRQGTPAAARTDQIAAEVKAERAASLRALSDELRNADYQSRCGTRERAVVELPGRACTESYYEVMVDPSLAAGAFTEAQLSPAALIREQDI